MFGRGRKVNVDLKIVVSAVVGSIVYSITESIMLGVIVFIVAVGLGVLFTERNNDEVDE